MKKYKIAFLACFLGLFLFTACESNQSTIQPESKQGKSYSTLTALPAHEYAIFLSKQIVVVTNELESRIIDGKNVMSGKYPRKDAVLNVSASLKRICDATDEVDVTLPAKTYEDDREDALRLLKNCQESLKEYEDALKKNDRSQMKKTCSLLIGDLNALTSVANTFYQ